MGAFIRPEYLLIRRSQNKAGTGQVNKDVAALLQKLKDQASGGASDLVADLQKTLAGLGVDGAGPAGEQQDGAGQSDTEQGGAQQPHGEGAGENTEEGGGGSGADEPGRRGGSGSGGGDDGAEQGTVFMDALGSLLMS